MEKKPEKSEKVFHGCFRKNRDGTNRIIESGKRCLTHISYPHLETDRGHTQWNSYPFPRAKTATRKKGESNRYHRQKSRENIKKWLEADDSELYFMKESDRFYIID